MRDDMPSALPADVAERDSDTERVLTPLEEALIEHRADEMLADRLAYDYAAFVDLMADIDPEVYWRPLQNAVARNLPIAYQSLVEIRGVVKNEAERLWLPELREKAEKEILGEQE